MLFFLFILFCRLLGNPLGGYLPGQLRHLRQTCCFSPGLNSPCNKKQSALVVHEARPPCGLATSWSLDPPPMKADGSTRLKIVVGMTCPFQPQPSKIRSGSPSWNRGPPGKSHELDGGTSAPQLAWQSLCLPASCFHVELVGCRRGCIGYHRASSWCIYSAMKYVSSRMAHRIYLCIYVYEGQWLGQSLARATSQVGAAIGCVRSADSTRPAASSVARYQTSACQTLGQRPDSV